MFPRYDGIGAALRTARKTQGITQAALAARLKISVPTLAAMESRGGSSWAAAERAAAALDRRIDGRSLPPGAGIGPRIAALRERRGISRRAAAERAGIAENTAAAIEKGRGGHMAAVEALAAAIGAGLFLADARGTPGYWQTAGVSSAHQAWRTPPDLLARLYPVVGGRFDVDPCSPSVDPRRAPVRARIHYAAPADDGLALPWVGSCFCNPPYGRALGSWIAKARHEAEAGRARPCILLIPARPDTAAWHDHIKERAHVVFLRGRLRFGADDGTDEAAPFPSALAMFGGGPEHAIALTAAFPEAWHVPSLRQPPGT